VTATATPAPMHARPTDPDANAIGNFLRQQRYWSPDAPQPYLHNDLHVMIDGREAMLSMYREMLQARHSIDIATWFLNADFEVVRGADRADLPPASDGTYQIASLLADRARDGVAARVLLWKGSLIGTMNSFRVNRTRKALVRHPGIQCAADGTEGFSHCHHQKVLLIDGHTAFVGGLDFTDQDADRWDTPEHRTRNNPKKRCWHDVHCRFTGPAASAVALNMAQRWREVTGESISFPIPESHTIPGMPIQVLRTLPKGVHDFAPDGDFGVDGALLTAILHAERYIYIENQYLWSSKITAALIHQMRRHPSRNFRIVVLLPDEPNIGRSDSDQMVRRLMKVGRKTGMIRVCTLGKPASAKKGTPPIYVHSKTMIVDDGWFCVGSANLNGRGLVSDTEMNISSVHEATARDLRLRLWCEHLQMPKEDLALLDVTETIDRFWPRDEGQPVGRVLPYNLGSWIRDLQIGVPEAVLLDL